jgi:hypothetical protein
MLSNIESGENLVKCNEPEPVDMQEVNVLMNEMSELYDESEETTNRSPKKGWLRPLTPHLG